MEMEKNSISVAEVREKLSKGGPKWWRSLSQVMDTPSFKKWVEDEFPERATMLQVDRRNFLKLTGAAVMMASLTGCRRLDKDKIVPFVKMPEDSVPGKPEYYASTFVHGGYGIGVLVESRQGRPTKVEGNPLHPSSLGKSSAITQASIYGLYDPFRSQQTMRGRESTSLAEFLKAGKAALAGKAGNGQGVVLVTEAITSPSLAGQIKAFLKKYPGAKWCVYEPAGRDNEFAGTELAFGRRVNPVYNFERADVIVSLDADFLLSGSGVARYSQDFASRRTVAGGDASRMSRLYMIESSPSSTGATADHALRVKASQVQAAAGRLASQVGVANSVANDPRLNAAWLDAVAKDLQSASGRCVVLAGEHQPPSVHALAHAMNAKLGAVGQTVTYTEVPEVGPDTAFTLKDAVADLNADKVDVLLVLGGNPVYLAPGDVNAKGAFAKAKFSARLGLYQDETSAVCQWHVPESHYLEAWGDARGHDGTISVAQPLIAPIYPSLAAIEFLETLSGGPRKSRAIVEDTHRPAGAVDTDLNPNAGAAFQKDWNQIVHDGMIRGSAFPAVSVTATADLSGMPAARPIEGPEVLFLPDATIHDGRYGTCAWLQELPRPMTSVTWDNLVLVSPKTAEKLGVENQDLVSLEVNGKKVEGPIFLAYGQAEDQIVVHMGYGRVSGAPLSFFDGNEVRGFDVNPLRTWQSPNMAAGGTITKVGGRQPVANTQEHHVMATTEGVMPLDIVRSGTIGEMAANPNFSPHPAEEKEELHSLYNDEEFKYDGYRWAMTIDLSLCTGCNACTQACQVENNIPSVGKSQVIKGREMHWIRVDRYYKGGFDSPTEVLHQPVTCQHCENAPCEPVCPVAATTHSKEGLNQMVYNRCVGTRYCSNNCPYKVRRFNFLNYADKTDYPTLTLLNNPDVSVRGRGVMEKCTFCVQRISAARIESKKSNTAIKDGDIVTACQQACPSKAIVFGDLSDEKSAVNKWQRDPRAYTLLREVNTRPRLKYLAKVRNVNKEIEAIEGTHGA
ncbi:MAG: TAT-variant-translocated molybdopterin oxidoreductase [Armatimonadetes bacterium]|nr:TAT-variant-translocated molybdopterin oxidoreductase [Armatimonadota bacterium]